MVSLCGVSFSDSCCRVCSWGLLDLSVVICCMWLLLLFC